jgi:hypothetical protein
MDNINILMANRTEYTNELINKCKQLFIQGFQSIYSTVKKNCKNKKMILRDLQDSLIQIPKWNQEIIDSEHERFIKSTNCEWLDNLIKASFITSAQILLTNSSVKPKKNLDLVIPKTNVFIHRCYVNIARELWKKPNLLYHGYSNAEIQKNLLEFESIIGEMILETIRKELPFKTVLDNFLNKTVNNEESESDDEVESIEEDELSEDENDDEVEQFVFGKEENNEKLELDFNNSLIIPKKVNEQYDDSKELDNNVKEFKEIVMEKELDEPDKKLENELNEPENELNEPEKELDEPEKELEENLDEPENKPEKELEENLDEPEKELNNTKEFKEIVMEKEQDNLFKSGGELEILKLENGVDEVETDEEEVILTNDEMMITNEKLMNNTRDNHESMYSDDDMSGDERRKRNNDKIASILGLNIDQREFRNDKSKIKKYLLLRK